MAKSSVLHRRSDPPVHLVAAESLGGALRGRHTMPAVVESWGPESPFLPQEQGKNAEAEFLQRSGLSPRHSRLTC